MKLLYVGKGFHAKVDDEDFGRVVHYTWWTQSKPNSRTTYAYTTIRGKNFSLHRMIMNYPDSDIDHKDRNGLNCQKDNLRLANKVQNSANKISVGKLKGVHRCRNRWRAIIGKYNHHIGVFDTPEEAARAYDREALKVYGEFAYLNYPVVTTSGVENE